jgi:Family of unknown function (DUF6325)
MIDVEDTGTIDWLVIEFPDGKAVNGELVPPLLDLVDRHVIRVLDALVLVKDSDGNLETMTTNDLDRDHIDDLGALVGASSGLIDDEDAEAVGSILGDGAAALAIVYENLWSLPFVRAARKAGGQLVASGRIPERAILARLDALES